METPIFCDDQKFPNFWKQKRFDFWCNSQFFFVLNVSTWGRTSFQWEKMNDIFLPFKLNNNFQPTNQPTNPPNPTQPNPTQPNQPTNQPIGSINEVPIWFTSSPFQSRNNICQTVKPGSTSKESRGWGCGMGMGIFQGGQMG